MPPRKAAAKPAPASKKAAPPPPTKKAPPAKKGAKQKEPAIIDDEQTVTEEVEVPVVKVPKVQEESSPQKEVKKCGGKKVPAKETPPKAQTPPSKAQKGKQSNEKPLEKEEVQEETPEEKPAQAKVNTNSKNSKKGKEVASTKKSAIEVVPEEPPKKVAPTIKLRGERYPIKTLLWTFLKIHKFPTGFETSEVYESEDLSLTIQETFPLLILNDSHYFMSAVLTKELWDKMRATTFNPDSGMRFSDLTNVRIKVTKFQLQLRQVNSKEVFTSFGSLEVRLIIHDCDVLLKPDQKEKRYTNSVFKDEEVRSLLLNVFHQIMTSYSQSSFVVPGIPNVFMKRKEGYPPGWQPCFEQPQSESFVKHPETDHDDMAKYQVFECQQTIGLPKTYPPLSEIADIIIEEKGVDYFEKLIAQRRRNEEQRRLNDAADKRKILTPTKYQQFTRGKFHDRGGYSNSTFKKKKPLEVLAEDAKVLCTHVRSLSQYQVKKEPKQKPKPASKEHLGCFTLAQYKRFIDWFKETKLDGLERPPTPPLKERDTFKRDVSGFYAKDHDFSILLVSQRIPKISEAQIAPRTIEVIKPEESCLTVDQPMEEPEENLEAKEEDAPSEDDKICVRDNSTTKRQKEGKVKSIVKEDAKLDEAEPITEKMQSTEKSESQSKLEEPAAKKRDEKLSSKKSSKSKHEESKITKEQNLKVEDSPTMDEQPEKSQVPAVVKEEAERDVEMQVSTQEDVKKKEVAKKPAPQPQKPPSKQKAAAKKKAAPPSKQQPASKKLKTK